jgi:hypothetical protein
MRYQAAHDPRIHFGLGNATRVAYLEVKWPKGGVTKLTDLSADRCVSIQENVGEVPSHFPPFKEKLP